MGVDKNRLLPYYPYMENEIDLSALSQNLSSRSSDDFLPLGHSRHQLFKKDYSRVLVHNAPFLFTAGDDDHIQLKQNFSLIIEKDTITEILPAADVNPEGFDLVYDAGKRGGVIITPGLINTHAHSHMYLMRSAMMLDEGEGIDETI